MYYSTGPSQCNAHFADGRRCPNPAVPGSQYCSQHRYLDGNRVLAGTIGGALIGNLLFPGVGGAVVGGIVGGILSSSSSTGSTGPHHGQ